MIGAAFVAASAILFAFNSVPSKLVLSTGFSPLLLVAIRFGLGVVVLLAANIARGSRRTLSEARQYRQYLCLLGYGISGFFVVPVFYLLAIRVLPVGVAVLVEYLAPVLVAAWSSLRSVEVNAAGVWIGLVLAVTGLAVVGMVWEGVSAQWSGLGFALIAAVALAASLIWGKRALADEDFLKVLTWGFGIGAAVSCLFLPLVRLSGSGVTAPEHGIPVWVLLLDIVLVGTVMPYGLLMAGLKRLSATRASILAVMEPVAAVGFGWVFLAQHLGVGQVIGAAVVLSGVICAELGRGRRGTASL